MLDTHAVARSLTDAGIEPAQADAITDAVRQAAEQGDHVTGDQFKVGPGPGVVIGHASGYAPAITQFTTTAGDWQDVYLGLLVDAEATGRVLDADANSVEGAQLIVRYGAALPGAGILAGFVSGSMTTDTDGAFALHSLVPNTPVTIQAEIGTQRTEAVTVTVGTGTVYENIVLRFTRGL